MPETPPWVKLLFCRHPDDHSALASEAERQWQPPVLQILLLGLWGSRAQEVRPHPPGEQLPPPQHSSCSLTLTLGGSHCSPGTNRV